MLIECNKCGAPLDVKGTERVVRCRYCGTSTKLRSTRTLAARTPDGWAPPPVWTPPEHVPARSRPLRYRVRKPSRIPPLVGCVVTVLGMGAGLAGTLVSSGVEIPFFGKVARWDGRSTLVCDLNEELVIEDREVTVLDGPVVDASATNCRVVIRGSRLSGPEVVHGGMNTTVTVEDSTLEASEVAISGSPNLTVFVRGTTTVQGGRAAISGDLNLEVEVNGGAVRADGAAIAGGLNPEVRLTQARVEGGQHALRLEQNADVEIRDSEVVGPTEWGRNADVRRP